MADNKVPCSSQPQQNRSEATQRSPLLRREASHHAVYLELQAGLRHALCTLTFLTGCDLTIAEFLAISRYSSPLEVDETRLSVVVESQSALSAQVGSQGAVYGVNTSYGGNASSVVKVDDVQKVHLSLQGLLAGIIPSQEDTGSDSHYRSISPLTHTLPSSWVRGAILLRVNNLLRGHSSVRWSLIEMLTQALCKHLTPVVPLQGSISASGDLSPLAYVAFALAGHPALDVIVGKGADAEQHSAPEGLKKANILPFIYAPKEVLAVINGTAVAASVATYALATAHTSLLLAQVLTAVHTEAMLGFQVPFESFLHDVARPHPGQCQVAHNIRTWLEDSFLLQDSKQGKVGQCTGPISMIVAAAIGAEVVCQKEDSHFLKQDRYAIRTAPQWLGPVVEDFLAAHEALSLELNSSTDNPLFDPVAKRMLHGGNFQASSVTNAVEKLRDGFSTIGRLLFAQQSELLNANRSNGLPGCLAPCAGPSLDGGLKGLDICNAAYISELNFLANRANHFVQSAEMDNQSINSLALISARYSIMAGEVTQKLMANSIYAALQAIDLRVAFAKWASHIVSDEGKVLDLLGVIRKQKVQSIARLITFEFMRNSHLDLCLRAEYAARAVCFLHFVEDPEVVEGSPLTSLASATTMSPLVLQESLATRLANSYTSIFRSYLDHPSSPNLQQLPLRSSSATASLWHFVRKELGIGPYTALEDFTWPSSASTDDSKIEINATTKGKTIGGEVSKIYDAMQDGRLDRFLSQLLEQSVRPTL